MRKGRRNESAAQRDNLEGFPWTRRVPGVLILASLILSWGTVVGAAEQEGAASVTPPALVDVQEAVICKGVENRAPVEPGETFESSVGRLYCFTRIAGANRETLVHHVWYPPGRNPHDQPLPVKSASWRTWSEKTVPAGWTGQWRVEVTAEDGTVLKTLVFQLQ
jgi:Protein of unknown function (DUF2914)